MKSTRKIFCVLLLIAYICSLASIAQAAEYKGTINTDDVFFRARPSTDAVYYWRLKKDTKITVTGVSGEFYAVKVDKQAGYVMKKFVTLSTADANALNGKTAKATATPAPKKSAYAGVTSIAKLGAAPAASQMGSSGDKVEKLQQALKIKGYYIGTVDGLYGENTQKAVKAYQKSVGLSQTGTADSATIARLFGTSTASASSGLSGITKISQITVPAASRKGDSGAKVKYLQQALKLKGFYSGPIDGSFGDLTVKAVKAFQKSMGLSQDGIAGNVTIRALFGKNAAGTAEVSPKTERLDWFNGGSNVIPKGATFIVKDVRTGKTFTCRRWSGYNHMDSEPKTASDTATMKAIYGGSWSWTRRPILVKYNGHVYAASMNGMPHGTSTIADNAFGGHFCIHFYKSRTHGTNRVDTGHQNCVAKAMNATW